jgi:hypothetical protein
MPEQTRINGSHQHRVNRRLPMPGQVRVALQRVRSAGSVDVRFEPAAWLHSRVDLAEAAGTDRLRRLPNAEC